jgi:hypothetical protein
VTSPTPTSICWTRATSRSRRTPVRSPRPPADSSPAYPPGRTSLRPPEHKHGRWRGSAALISHGQSPATDPSRHTARPTGTWPHICHSQPHTTGGDCTQPHETGPAPGRICAGQEPVRRDVAGPGLEPGQAEPAVLHPCDRARLPSTGAIWLPGRVSWHDGGGDQPLGSGDVDVGASLEVAGPRLVRPEVGDLAEAVPAAPALPGRPGRGRDSRQ